MSAPRVVVAAACLLAAAVSPALAQRRPQEKEQRIERQLSAVAPDAVRLFHDATIAMDQHDYATAVRLYRAVVEQAPGFSPAVRRLGASLAAAGQEDEGVKYAEEAVRIERSADNLASLADVLMTPRAGRAIPPATSRRALSLAKQARTAAGGDADASYLATVARLALITGEEAEFRVAVRALESAFPRDMATHYFVALTRAIDEDWAAAVSEIREAERLGLPHEAAEQFLASGVRLRANVRRGINVGLLALIAWAVLLLALLAAGKTLSTVTLRSIESADPNDGAAPREVALRRIYRALINAAGTFYYISLPVVIAVVIAATVAIVYGFYAVGRIPVRLVAFLVFGAIVTIYKMVQSLFIRVEGADPGRSLSDVEAPELWALTRRVAAAVGTRPIDEIRVTPGTEMAVYERGTRRERKQGLSRRILVLGVGLLDGFARAPFCAVLAHEYGHFAHGDTAGGDVALRVQQDMHKFALAMIQHGQAVWWNLAFQFLRVYAFLFQRITHGATRLQEVLADRVAARLYGARQFEDGLRHVVRRSIQFTFLANSEISTALEGGRALQNLYQERSNSVPGMEEEIERALARPTTEDDTHPGPLDRFRLVSGLTSAPEQADSGMVWDLFSDRAALTAEMTAAVASHVGAAAASA